MSSPGRLISQIDGVVYVDEVAPMGSAGIDTEVNSSSSKSRTVDTQQLIRPARQHFSDGEIRLLVDMAIDNREILRSREEGSVTLRDQLYHNIAAAMSGLNPEAAPKTAGQIRKKLDQMISKARKLLDEHQEVGFIRQKVPPMLMRLANEYVMWAQKHWPRYSDLLPWQGHDNTVQDPNGMYNLSPTALVHPSFKDTQAVGDPPRGPTINTPGDGLETTMIGLQKDLARLDCELLSEKILLVNAEVINLRTQLLRRRRMEMPEGPDPALEFATSFGACPESESVLTESAMAKAVQLAAKAVEELQEHQAQMNAAAMIAAQAR
ncbi:hypothetical protein Pmar_PMAR026521 [Perkinsus marinus ATCC 50983]|uniref:Uncharacterized protein n=1 Tax=Perkinsus marinus (strain ATCC 50983 / TXsc) TaxID=423536 RepID=C5LDS3_PERM5|nr:hypothetical protein Pmar_PMAR026521 [Perkinsus marinus ATCC 50983]EER05087.1 hypothetical protein Pmar_PMAR026521 [Perkinsus marinus ATCC 50983]|eukprot:XP_002773271.1 hypothetical protein Pmar_PMAR026521 [Perkinsus marinus ATCC 50983]